LGKFVAAEISEQLGIGYRAKECDLGHSPGWAIQANIESDNGGGPNIDNDVNDRSADDPCSVHAGSKVDIRNR